MFPSIPIATAPTTRKKKSRPSDTRMMDLPKDVMWKDGWKGEYPIGANALKNSLDELGWSPFIIMGTMGKLPFFSEFRKTKRLANSWSVENDVKGLESVTTIPCRNKEVTIFGIFDHNLMRVTRKPKPPLATRENHLPPQLFNLIPPKAPSSSIPTSGEINSAEPQPKPALKSSPPAGLSNSVKLPRHSVPSVKQITTIIKRKDTTPVTSENQSQNQWEDGDSESSDEEVVLPLESEYRDKVGNAETNRSNFWWRQGITPTLPEELAGEWRRKLRSARRREEESLMDIVKLGLVVETRKLHRRTIAWLCAEPEPAPNETIVNWILTRLVLMCQEKKWQGSTLSTKLASCQGAMAHLPIYREGVPPVVLKNSSEWRLALKGAGNIMKRALPRQATILTEDSLSKSLELEPVKRIRVALEIAWITAARGGDVVKLRTTDVWSDDKGSWVRFVVGKTATSQPYTVTTAPMSQEAMDYLSERRKEVDATQWLFPQVLGSHLKETLSWNRDRFAGGHCRS